MKRFLFLILFAPQIASAQNIITAAGNGVPSTSGNNGPATNASLDAPIAISADALGNFYFIDGARCQIRKVNASRVITHFAGQTACFADTAGVRSGDGGPATAASFNMPSGMAADATGKVYIADQGNRRVRMINTAGNIVTIAGTGAIGSPAGDGGPATDAHIEPIDVAVDAAGNLYITDKVQNGIRKVDAVTGIITTIAGTGTLGASGDNGPATAAPLDPSAIAADTHGNIFVVNGNSVVRKIDLTTGIITRVAGNNTVGSSGDGGAATAASFNYIADIALDTAGNMYIADMNNNVIRKVNTAGTISNFAGNYTAGFSGDGGPAGAAKLNTPTAVAIDVTNGLLIGDLGNHRIRKIGGYFLSLPPVCLSGEITIFPNPATTQLNITSGAEKIQNVSITDITGRVVRIDDFAALSAIQINVSDLATGIYFLRVNNLYNYKLLKQ